MKKVSQKCQHIYLRPHLNFEFNLAYILWVPFRNAIWHACLTPIHFFISLPLGHSNTEYIVISYFHCFLIENWPFQPFKAKRISEAIKPHYKYEIKLVQLGKRKYFQEYMTMWQSVALPIDDGKRRFKRAIVYALPKHFIPLLFRYIIVLMIPLIGSINCITHILTNQQSGLKGLICSTGVCIMSFVSPLYWL